MSTREQSAENQERELRRWADQLGFEVVAVYADTASGARDDRGALADVLTDAHGREFGVLLLWALDRLSRQGIVATARYLEQLRVAGVRVMSHQEAWLDTGGPVGDLLVAIFAWLAQQERERLGARVRAGLARAREQGTRSGKAIGRPRCAVDAEEVRRRRAAGQPWRKIARALKTPSRTLRSLEKAGENPQANIAPGGALSTYPPGASDGRATR